MKRARRTPSSFDVARLAGVSQSAVSRAFSGEGVAAETRARILKAADELGYRPNALIRAISTQSNLVAVVMGEITNPFYPEVLDGLLTELEGRGFRVLLKRIDKAETADAAVEEALTYRVRGVVITSSVISREMAERCARSALPVVLFNRYVRDVPISTVCCDNVEAGRAVANRLLDLGHRRLAFVSGSRNATSNLDRRKGFLDRIAERMGGEVPEFGDEHAYAVGAAAAEALMALPAPPDGVFCASDVLAFGAIDAFRAAGLRVPEDVSVIGFDDIPAAAWGAYALTTMRQARRRMVREVVETLARRIGGEPPGPVRLVPAELVVRATVRARG